MNKKAVVIGGRGKIGTHLVPMLVRDGYETVTVTRSSSPPFEWSEEWESVTNLAIDRDELESIGEFGNAIRDINADVVIDLICFTPESAQQLCTALMGNVTHFLSCGSVWIHGPSIVVPCSESENLNAIGDYGINKQKMTTYLLEEYQKSGFPATIIHPGHIVGKGHKPINPVGNQNMDVFRKLMCGQPISMPNLGMETLHHVHAKDVARQYMLAIHAKEKSFGEDFHAVSERAISCRGFAMEFAAHYGKKAEIEFWPLDEWRKNQIEMDAMLTMDHLLHSPSASIEKAKEILGYVPEYTSLEAIFESVESLGL